MLSNFAKEQGIKTHWDCWQKNRFLEQNLALIEICLRIEKIEEELKIKNKTS